LGIKFPTISVYKICPSIASCCLVAWTTNPYLSNNGTPKFLTPLQWGGINI